MIQLDKIKATWGTQSITTRLWFTTLASGLIYLAFTLPFLLHRYYNYAPPVDYAKLTHHSALGFTAYLAGILALFGLYLLTLRTLLLIDNTLTEWTKLRFVLLGGSTFALILAFSYPQTAIDILVYALRTRGWVRYGLSPFSTTSGLLPSSDVLIALAGEWVDAASPYGPLWEWLSLGAYRLGGGRYLTHLLALKFIAVLAYLGSAWMVYQILRIIKPQWALVGTASFTINPLVLLESAQNGHNDIVMVFFFLLAVWAFVRNMQADSKRKFLYPTIFVFAFAASILVKWMTVLVLPIFLLAIALRESTWWRRIFSLALHGGALSILILLAMWPYWPGFENWALLSADQGAGRSLFALLVLIIRPMVPAGTSFDIVRVVLYSIFGGIFLWGLWQVWMSGKTGKPIDRIHSTLIASFAVFFVYIFLAAPVFHAWYLLWFLPLTALLLFEPRVTSVSFVASLSALLIIPYYETVRVWIPYLNQNHLVGHLIGVLLLLLPVTYTLLYPIHLLLKNDVL